MMDNFKKLFKDCASLYKRLNWKGHVVLTAFAVLAAIPGALALICSAEAGDVQTEAKQSEPVPYVMFTSYENESEVRYELTDEERQLVASVVMAEAGAEPYAGKIAVAQCILNACEKEGIRPTEAVVEYKYTKNRPEPSEEVLRAVSAVFDLGQVATTEFYTFMPQLLSTASSTSLRSS